MKDFFKAGVYRFIFLGFNFLVGLFIAALAGAELFGTISLMIVNAALLHLLTAFGADQAIVWHGASKKFDNNKSFTFTFFSGLLQFVIFLLIAIIFFQASQKTLLISNISIDYFYLELIYFSGLIFLDKYISLLYAQQKARVCNLILAAVTLIAVVILSLIRFGYLKSEIDPLSFFCFLSFLQACSVVFLFHFKTKISFSHFKKDDLHSFFRFSGIVFISNLIQFLAYRTDYWLINYFKGIDQVGVYSQANKFAGLVWILPNIIAALLIPVMSQPGSSIKEKEMTGITRLFSLLNIIILGFLVLVSYLTYSYFLQPEYEKGFIPMLYMLPGYYFFSISIILAAYFSAKNLLWINFAGSSICFISIVVADLVLIPSMGIKGAAWANTIAYGLAAAFTISMFLKYSNLRIADLFILKKNDFKQFTKMQ